MQLIEVIHFYLGCKMWDSGADIGYEICTLMGVDNSLGFLTVSDEHGNCGIKVADIKPIIYPLSAMTKDHVKSLGDLAITPEQITAAFRVSKNTAEQAVARSQALCTQYLLSQKFDLFGLIESGQAIDCTTLTTDPYKK